MMYPLRALEEALSQQVSTINARVILERSRRALHDPNRLTQEDQARFLIAVRTTLRLFTSEDRATAIIDDFTKRIAPRSSSSDPRGGPGQDQEQELLAFAMRDENDLRTARASARYTCLSYAARASDAQRVATAVSELGRNIINYTPGGQIEIEVRRGPPLRVRLIAVDNGSGIAQLEEILAGKYRSKTGLGRGLLGVKRLMDQFRVQTSAQGTRIEAEVTFQC
jgi:serine/threonine-protein kinase RsbT